MLKKINSKLERLFDQNSAPHFLSDPTLTNARKNFEPVDNHLVLENLSYVFSEDVNSGNLANLYSQLCAHFEIGYLAARGKQQLTMFGKAWPISEKAEILKLPVTPIFKIFKSDATGFLTHFALLEIDPDKKMYSYMVRIAEGHYFVFLTAIAEPWARIKIESLQKTLMKINFNL